MFRRWGSAGEQEHLTEGLKLQDLSWREDAHGPWPDSALACWLAGPTFPHWSPPQPPQFPRGQ